jgi:hypothetical protein
MSVPFFRSFRGASAASEPGIQIQARSSFLDSGFGAARRPGVTIVFESSPDGERQRA